MTEEDFIQQAVNKGYEESIKRSMQRVKYKQDRYNEKINKLHAKRKVERQNRKNARRH